MGYVKTEHAGVYRSENIYVRTIPLLVLNELADTPHNAFVKCFGSRKEAKTAAFATLTKHHFNRIPSLLYIFLVGLRHLWSIPEGEETMKKEVTPERVMELGEEWSRLLLRQMNSKERLAGLSPEERLAGLSLEERLAGISPEERLAGISPEERLAGISPEEVLTRLPLEEIEAWLAKQRAEQTKTTARKTKSSPARNN